MNLQIITGTLNRHMDVRTAASQGCGRPFLLLPHPIPGPACPLRLLGDRSPESHNLRWVFRRRPREYALIKRTSRFRLNPPLNSPATATPPSLSAIKPIKRGDRRLIGRESQARRDRRADLVTRRRVAQMTPEEMRRMLLTHELTGIKNRRAYAEDPAFPIQAAIDADSLKWFNDTLGHEVGDRVLRAIAAALNEVTPNAYHLAGDEFVIQSTSKKELLGMLSRIRSLLQRVTIEASGFDGSIFIKRGLEIAYGIGGSREESEKALAHAKKSREASGERAIRGEPPPSGLTRIPQERSK